MQQLSKAEAYYQRINPWVIYKTCSETGESYPVWRGKRQCDAMGMLTVYQRFNMPGRYEVRYESR